MAFNQKYHKNINTVFAFIINMVFNLRNVIREIALQLTTDELKAAFKRAGLWRLGWTFDKAMECEATRRTLTRIARIAHDKQTADGNPAPEQLELI